MGTAFKTLGKSVPHSLAHCLFPFSLSDNLEERVSTCPDVLLTPLIMLQIYNSGYILTSVTCFHG